MIADAIMKAFGAKESDFIIRINSRELVDKFLKDYMKLDDSQIYETSKLIDRWHKMGRDEFHDQAKSILKDEKLYKELVDLMESKDLTSLPDEVRQDQSTKRLTDLMALLKESGAKSA